MTRVNAIIAAIFILLLTGLGGAATYYHGQYQSAEQRARDALTLASQRQATINDMQARQRDVAALDAKYTQEVADAKSTIETLRSDVAAGRKRLQLNARCTASNGTATASVDDATTPRLNNSAIRDYFTLRQRIETATKQIAGLQEYINLVCK